MISSFRRSIASLVCAVMAFQPLAVSYAASQQYRIPLRLGDVTSQVELELNPSPVDFEDVAVGQVRTLEAKLRNKGSADARGVTLNTMAPFSVDASACTYVPAGGDCSVWLSFAPGEAGRAIGALNIASGTTSLQSILLGNGVGLIADLDVSDGGGWNFGQVELDTKSDVKTLTLRNTGTAVLPLSSVGLLKGSDEYKLTHTCTDSLAPGASCEVTVWFEPTEFGQRLGAFRVKSADGSVRDVWLLGFGGVEQPSPEQTQGKLSAATELDFGAVVLPTPGQVRTLTLANTGATLLTLSPLVLSGTDTSAFALKSECGLTLAPYSSCTVHLTFTPTALAKYAAQLEFSAGEAEYLQARTIAIRGAGVTTPSGLIASPTAVDFGSTTKLSGIEKVVRLTNTADEPQTLRVSYASNPQNFVVLGGCEAAIASEASCDLRLLYQAYSPNRADGELILLTATGQSLTVPLTGAVPTPVLIVSPSALVFGTTNVEVASPAKNITLTNTGLAPVELSSLRIASGAEFTQSATCGETITPGASCTIPVIFTPYASKKRTSSLVIESNDPQTPHHDVSLEGWGQIGALSAQPTSLYFSTIETNTEAQKSFTLSNRGPGTVRIPRMVITGAGAGGYSQANTCQELLAVGQACEVTVTFVPTQVRSYAAQLEVYTGDGVSASLWLNGWGHAPKEGKLDFFPNPVDFGSVSIYRPASKVIQFKNTGTADLRVTSVSVSGADAALITQDDNCVSVISTGATCLVTLTGALSELRTYSAQLDIQVEGANAQMVAIAATGVELLSDAQLSVTPGLVDFGQIVAGIPVEQTLSVTNTGAARATLVAGELSHPALTLTSECRGELAPGTSCEFGLQLKSNQSILSSLTLRTQEGHRVQVPVKATIPLPELVVSSSHLAFDATAIGAQSTPQVVRLSNKGNAPLNLGSIQLQGLQYLEFFKASPCGPVLSPAQSCDVSISFAPQAAGSRTASLVIASNDAKTPSVVVSLAGTGLGDPAKVPVLSITPKTLVFAGTAVGQTAPPLSIELKNTGLARLAFAGLGLSDDIDFEQSNNCAEGLAPGETCLVSVHFTPTQLGLRDADLVMDSDAANGALQFVSVSGTGLALAPVPASLTLTPDVVAFGDQPVSVRSDAQVVSVTNSGTVPLRINSLQVIAGEGIFTVQSACPAMLAVGESCEGVVSFKPNTAGAVSGVLRVTSGHSGGPIDVVLTGAGLAPTASTMPTMVDFGRVYVNQSKNQLIQLTNTSDVALVVHGVGLTDTSAQNGVTATNTCLAGVAAQASCDILVTARPVVAGLKTNSLVVSTSAGVFTVPVSVTGAYMALGSITPAQIPASGGSAVTISGAGFTSSSKILFDGIEASTLSLISATQLVAMAPAHAPGKVSVTLTDEGATPIFKANALEYVAAPEIASVSPNSGSIAGGWSATLTGANFIAGMKVTVDGQPAAITRLDSALQADIRVPARKAVIAGAVDVGVSSVGGATSLPGGLTYTVPVAQLVLSGATGQFGDISREGRYGQTAVLHNAGPSAVRLSSIALSSSVVGVFSRTAGSCPDSFPAELAQGASCSIEFSAYGSALGMATGELRVTTDIPAEGEEVLALSANVIEPDYSLSGSPGTMSLASGNFGVTAALSEDGKSNPPLTRTVYLNNSFKVSGTRISDITITLASREVEEFRILDVFAVSDSGASRSAGAAISPDGRTALNANVDDGHGAYPHLAVKLQYAPRAAGEHNTQLAIAFNSGRVAGLPLYGQAKYLNVAEVSGDGDFGVNAYSDNAQGIQTTTKTFSIRSTEAIGKLLRASRLHIIGAEASAFEIVGFSGRTVGEPLEVQDVFPSAMVQATPASVLTVSVRFKPLRLGAHGAQLVIESNTDGAPLFVGLSGVGARDVALELSEGAGISPLTDYPMTGINASMVKDVYLRNTGTVGRVTFTGMQIVGSPAFTLVDYGQAANVTKATVAKPAAGARYVNVTFTAVDAAGSGAKDFFSSIRFAPLTVGLHEAIVTVWHDAPGEFTTFMIKGEAVRAAAVLSNVATLPVIEPNGDFGIASFNGLGHASNQSKAASFYVVNATAIGRLKVTRLQIVGEDAQAFQITGYKGMLVGTAPSGDVRPSTMVQMSSTEALPFSLKFTPTHLGGHEAYLQVSHDGMNASPLTLPLSGYGERDIVFAVSGGAGIVPLAAFDATAIPQTMTKTVYLRNVGSAGLARYAGFALTGSNAFTVKAVGLVARNTATFTPAVNYAQPVRQGVFTLEGADVLKAPSGLTDLAITVQAVMTERDTQSAQLSVFHDGPGEQTILELVGGYYAPNLAFYDANDLANPIAGVDFANVELGIASAPYPLVLRNTGNVSVTLKSSMLALPAPFTYTADSSCAAMTLAPDAACELAIIFTPAKEQAYKATLSVGDSAQRLSPVELMLQGQGTLARLEYWNEAQTGQLTELVFPETEIGARSTATVVVRNAGLATLRIAESDIPVGEPFEVVATSCQEAVLLPSETCDIELVFAPTIGGKFEGVRWQLSLASNAIGSLSLPLKGRTPPVPFVEVVAGHQHTFARKSDGTWWATGQNAYGQLGLGNTTNRSSFTQVPALTGATQVVAGSSHTFARKSDGTWWATGANTSGQLGLGNTTNRSSFTQVPALSDATQVVAGGSSTFARKSNGTWWAAGYNLFSHLGLGDYAERKSFTQVSALTGATRVVAGERNTFARKSDGTWWAVGYNPNGQLGLGDIADRRSFTLVPALTDATQVVASVFFTFARKSDGTWWAVGHNYYGQLGLGNTTNRSSFTQVPDLTGATQVVAGEYHTIARKSDGTLWATGSNGHGQLGLGNTTNRSSFTPVPALTDAMQVVAGGYHTFARKSDGTWGATGNNGQGQLGLGNIGNRTSFTQIPGD